MPRDEIRLFMVSIRMSEQGKFEGMMVTFLMAERAW